MNEEEKEAKLRAMLDQHRQGWSNKPENLPDVDNVEPGHEEAVANGHARRLSIDQSIQLAISSKSTEELMREAQQAKEELQEAGDLPPEEDLHEESDAVEDEEGHGDGEAQEIQEPREPKSERGYCGTGDDCVIM